MYGAITANERMKIINALHKTCFGEDNGFEIYSTPNVEEVDFEPKLKRARLQVESKMRKELKENVFNNLAKSLNDSNEKIATSMGNMLYHFAKAVVGDEHKREMYRKNIVHEKENHFSETNVEMNENYD